MVVLYEDPDLLVRQEVITWPQLEKDHKVRWRQPLA